jgi:hypothetical protein
MTLFDPSTFEPAPPRPAEQPEPIDDGLACRAVGCTRPYRDHIVTLAANENARHRPANPPTKKRKRP